MMQKLRPYLTLLLVLVITLTAHSAGAMRGTGDALGQMVICTGTGPVTIYTDQDGQPAQAPHECPDCIMLVLAPIPAPDQIPAHVQAAQPSLLPPWQTWTHPSRSHLRATARAPPLNF